MFAYLSPSFGILNLQSCPRFHPHITHACKTHRLLQCWLPCRSVLLSGQFEWLQGEGTKAIRDLEAGLGTSAVQGSDAWKALESLHCLYEVHTLLPPNLTPRSSAAAFRGQQWVTRTPTCHSNLQVYAMGKCSVTQRQCGLRLHAVSLIRQGVSLYFVSDAAGRT